MLCTLQGGDFDRTTETSELYDAVLTGLVGQDEPNQMQTPATKHRPLEMESKPPSLDIGQQSTDKHSLYVGNFSWVSATQNLFHLLIVDCYKIVHAPCMIWLKLKVDMQKQYKLMFIHIHILSLIFCFFQWISDSDIMHMAQALGVKDIIEIKFAENKSNGQSRG